MGAGLSVETRSRLVTKQAIWQFYPRGYRGSATDLSKRGRVPVACRSAGHGLPHQPVLQPLRQREAEATASASARSAIVRRHPAQTRGRGARPLKPYFRTAGRQHGRGPSRSGAARPASATVGSRRCVDRFSCRLMAPAPPGGGPRPRPNTPANRRGVLQAQVLGRCRRIPAMATSTTQVKTDRAGDPRPGFAVTPPAPVSPPRNTDENYLR